MLTIEQITDAVRNEISNLLRRREKVNIDSIIERYIEWSDNTTLVEKHIRVMYDNEFKK